MALRIGGRAALISGLGLNFVTDNPELKENLDQILLYSDNMDPLTKAAAFVAAWTAVKVFCVDFAGVALVSIFHLSILDFYVISFFRRGVIAMLFYRMLNSPIFLAQNHDRRSHLESCLAESSKALLHLQELPPLEVLLLLIWQKLIVRSERKRWNCWTNIHPCEESKGRWLAMV